LKRWGRMDSWIKRLEDPTGSDGPSSIEIADSEKNDKMGPGHKDIKISRIHVSDIFKQDFSPPSGLVSPTSKNPVTSFKKEQKHTSSITQQPINSRVSKVSTTTTSAPSQNIFNQNIETSAPTSFKEYEQTTSTVASPTNSPRTKPFTQQLTDPQFSKAYSSISIIESKNMKQNETAVTQLESKKEAHVKETVESKEMKSTVEIPQGIDRSGTKESIILNTTHSPQPSTDNLAEHVQEDDDTKLKKRIELIQQFVLSEKEYVSLLDIVEKLYYSKVTDSECSSKDKQIIFSNIIEILNFHQNLLNHVLESISQPPENVQISACYLKLSESLKMYSTYCANYPFSLDKLIKLKETSEDFDIFLEYTKNKPQNQNRLLEDYLLLPFERICYYPKFFEQLKKCTPDSHPDRVNTVTITDKTRAICKYVKEKKQRGDNMLKLQEIQSRLDSTKVDGKDLNLATPSRKWLKEGWITKISGNKKVDLYFYLFNDMILYCKQNVLVKKNFFHVEGMIPVTAVLIRDSISPETQKNGIDLYRIDKKKIVHFDL